MASVSLRGMSCPPSLGGTLGGKLAGRIKPGVLRYVVIAIGVTVSIVYFTR